MLLVPDLRHLGQRAARAGQAARREVGVRSRRQRHAEPERHAEQLGQRQQLRELEQGGGLAR
eukprot:11190869-Lingulodinium_polyedra.AAC.1